MITMTHMGEHCKMHLPVCAAFVGRMRTEFPQAKWSYVYGIRPLIEVVIPEGLMDEFQKVIDTYYDSEGNVRDQLPKKDKPRARDKRDEDTFRYRQEEDKVYGYPPGMPYEPIDPATWFGFDPAVGEAEDEMEARRQRMREELRSEATRRVQEEFMREQLELLEKARQQEAAKRAQERARRPPPPPPPQPGWGHDPGGFTDWFKRFQEEAARQGQRPPPHPEPPRPYATHTSIDIKVQITKQYPYHAELGLVPGAPAVVVRAAFRALALIYHPDKPEGSTEKMQKLNKAFTEVKKYERIQD